MDYDHLSVFELVTTQLGSPGTVCAGGRYAGLIEQIGGKAAPAVGWALGVERILELLKEQGRLPEAPVPDAYAVIPDASAMPAVLPVLRALRSAGVSVLMHTGSADGMGSMKSQFKKADASGARYALIFGADELAQGMVAVKPLRSGTTGVPEQTLLPCADSLQWAERLR
jgi:histidyl-tRNA synthetase